MRVGNGRINGSVATKVVVPASDTLDGRTAPVSRGAPGGCALVEGGVRSRRVRCPKLGVHAVERHLVGKGIGVTADESLAEITSGPAADREVVAPAHLDVMDIENTVIAFVLIPPIRHAVGVLVDVQSVDE